MSEIDDIFASKGNTNAVGPVLSTSTAACLSKRKKKKDRAQKKTLAATKTSISYSPSKEEDSQRRSEKRPPPETIVDSSSTVTQLKRQKIDNVEKSHPKKMGHRPPKVDDEDETSFKNSRGTGPRRRTEEGWLVYKEDELGIGEGGGDTPLCPFDCDCCF
ncbi:hypothetical protein AX17_000786 [Amanita inopinata Kibby_2008]|nr:hypothetical protein AX17_000786 [Amanita inopinata Kibby_2008]